jgi:hypothetical protein
MNTQKNRGIHWTDGEGNERVISRDAWRADILPRVLAGHWHDADLLFLDVVIGTEDGFREEMLPFAARLLSLEGESERAIACNAFLQANTGKAKDALSALGSYLAAHPPSLRILYTLAQAQEISGDRDGLLRALSQGLLLDPNEPAFLDWWYQFHKETLNETQAEKALFEMAKVRGSWLAEIWLSRALLEDRKIAEVLSIYHRLLNTAGNESLALQEISGHLGETGYFQEALDLMYPLYEPDRHGPLTGLNLLQACVDAGAVELGRKLVERMLQQDWPHLRAVLAKFRDGFYRSPDDLLSARYISN